MKIERAFATKLFSQRSVFFPVDYPDGYRKFRGEWSPITALKRRDMAVHLRNPRANYQEVLIPMNEWAIHLYSDG